jgi:hypothetical protein
MKVSKFTRDVFKTAKTFKWVKMITTAPEGTVANVRLGINQSFVDIYYNAVTGTTSYAYIESNKRVFGANNMKIGWHWHPYGDVQKHLPDKQITIETFLKTLEKELRGCRDKCIISSW